MNETTTSTQGPLRALLVGIQDMHMDEAQAACLLSELAGLVRTLELHCQDSVLVKLREPSPALGLGSGKAEEIAELARSLEVDCIIFDFDLSPSQQRNWERLSDLVCIDRQEIILKIFSMRAQTKEARLQIELAELQHRLPRLAHKHLDLSQQRGGSHGAKGEGEKKLELDRRSIEQRIDRLKKELAAVELNRQTQRKRREKTPVPSCALVGYTNAGKSSLLNALTQADAFVEDKLFATLDPTTRRMERSDGSPILLTDTVGFIRRLPHGLVKAFRSTLEEAAFADLVIIVLDASDSEVIEHYSTSMAVLKDLKADIKPQLIVLNKIDAAPSAHILEGLNFRFKNALRISAKTGRGLEQLKARIDEEIGGSLCTLHLPHNRSDLAALVHREGSSVQQEYHDEGITLTARLSVRLQGQLKKYIVGNE